MIKRTAPVRPPSKKELLTLRLMIVIGLVSMLLFLFKLLQKSMIGFAPIYWIQMIVFIFICCKILYEWIHYLFITIPPTPPTKKIYTVDVFTTYCAEEPYEMIEETLYAIQAITYPHHTYLCDETNDPNLRDLCKRIGVNHITREIKIDAKAGNINNALQQSTGELCVILDPDHVPFPEFLDPIVNHFNDPEIGFVQIVQAYYNMDDGLIAKGAAQQTYQFYGPMMMTMNKYGTVQAIGANCSFRRTALESIGGHAAGLAEDMNTAMHLHAKGWKSLYVPAVLARGLVPNTISAYYSQQLKWSRGVFELLVTSYPKLFHQFTWKQKLHYGLIPLHYLSGIIFLLNFLIPILSLSLDVIPFKMDLAEFAILGFPFAISILMIRHFVQIWVMEDEERGFHVVGGLLLIGTWWVYILGFFYTIIRKKVPYIPTQKDNQEKVSLALYLPNILLLVASVAAIIYGLTTDWNPYTIIMSGFAAFNCFILIFTIYAGLQNIIWQNLELNNKTGSFINTILTFKSVFWQIRRRMYAGLRNSTVLISIVIACFLLYFIKTSNLFTNDLSQPKKYDKDILYSGIFAPSASNGLSNIQSIQQLEQKNQLNFNIISFYIPWGNKQQCYISPKLMDSVYQKNAIPMITWEPWQNLFADIQNKSIPNNEKKVFQRILKGEYDAYIEEFSLQIKALNHPVFLRFAHEADNPQYPWSKIGDNTSDEFKEAWKYIHTYFKKKKVWNVIWVWNPWKSDAIDDYFPGQEYVDWLAVTNLNYGYLNPDKKDYSMSELYAGFHSYPIYQSGLPVMLAEMGSLQTENEKQKWFTDAFSQIKSKFPEINAYVLFNSGIDKNVPNSQTTTNIDWRISDMHFLTKWMDKKDLKCLNSFTELSMDSIYTKSKKIPKEFNTIKGINYTKGQNWTTNYHALTKKELINDFKEIKAIGFNTIKWNGPGIYDQNILKIAEQQALKVQYSFWTPDNNLVDKNRMDAFGKNVLKTITALKSNSNIISWNIGNSVIGKLGLYYAKPDLYSKQIDYIRWLKKLIADIKVIDATRPITLDIDVDEYLIPMSNILQNNLPEIDAYGLAMTEKPIEPNYLEQLSIPYFFSKINASTYLNLYHKNAVAFISNWQDEETKNHVSFDGLKDKFGRNKLELSQIRNAFQGQPNQVNFPKIKILLPATTIIPNKTLEYHALINKEGQWKMADKENNLVFTWQLVKHDIYGNPVSMKLLGEASSISFSLNEYPEKYRLLLYVSNGKDVQIIQSSLNTPLF
jgi:hypothetical protein